MSKLIYINGDSADRDLSTSIPVDHLRVIEAQSPNTCRLWHASPIGGYSSVICTNMISGKDFKELCKDFSKAVNSGKSNEIVFIDKFANTSFSNQVDISGASITYDSSAGNQTVSGDLSVTGTVSAATGSIVGDLTLADGSITDSSGAISFGDEALSTTGTLSSGNTTVDGLVYDPVIVTATAAGDGVGIIASGKSMVKVTSTDANHIVTLPIPSIGQVIYIVEDGTTGYELRSSTPASISINGGSGADFESAIAGATAYIRCLAVSTTAWIANQFAAAGTESAVEVANNT
tara:strand:+ start:384 stop:1256 length:873 start_codon:yes stop_codon:yes gene_type:complete